MRIYFLSSRPCALYIGGVYYGTVCDFERFAEISLSDGLPVQFVPENALPISFFLNESLPFSPPERCEIYLLEEGIAIYAKDFQPVDFSLRVVAQKREEGLLATVFSQGRLQASFESVDGVFTATLPQVFEECALSFQENLIFLEGKEHLAVFNRKGERLFYEKVLSWSVEESKLHVVLPLSDRYKRTAKCSYSLTETECPRLSYLLLQAEETDRFSLVAYAFFESVRIGADYQSFLSPPLREKDVVAFLGAFLSVLPTDEPNGCRLVYKKSPRIFEVRTFRVSVENGEITDIQG